MAEIRVLPKNVADMIAAGEVVERPASAAKELLENAIDAGAKSVTVEIRRGGVSYLRVSDDGKGIPAGEVPTAFLRHATSKLRTEADLEAIGTLGFRGEALAAIAAVAHVEMLTKPREAENGYTITIEGGQTLHQGEAGCPDGTTVVVRSLFFNLPARYKFLKRDAAEGAAVHAVVQREALAHPEVAFRFLRDGQQELSTAGDGSLEDTIYAVLGKDFARGCVPVQGGSDSVRVTGYVTRPTACRGSRSGQYYFLNGRWIRSKLITAALENAYRNQKMVGKFPGGVLHVTTNPAAVDVNAHPTKTEVKFVRDKDVYDGVYYAVLSALEGGEDRPALRLDDPIPREAAAAFPPGEELLVFHSPAVTAPRRPSGVGWDEVAEAPAELPPGADAFRVSQIFAPPEVSREGPENPPETGEIPRKTLENSAKAGTDTQKTFQNQPKPRENPWLAAENQVARAAEGPGETPGDVPTPPEQEKLAGLEAEDELPWRVVGEVMDTYIIVEQGESVLFIDKHAAHERMNFDRLKAQGGRAMSQELLAPLTFRPGPEEGAALLEHVELLEEFGFALEDFGGGSLAVSRVPHFLTPEEAPQALAELARILLSTGSLDPAGQRDELLHTMACKAAIKGGQKNGPQELLRVAQAVMSGQVRHCPHGRPVAARLSRSQLERQIGRS